MSKVRIASMTALVSIAMVSAGVFAAVAGRPDDPKPAMKPASSPRTTAVEAQVSSPRSDDLVEVRGIVVGPGGKPVAGATLAPYYYDRDTRPGPLGISGPDGRFSIRRARSKWWAGSADSGHYPWLIASSPGFGPGWASEVSKDDEPVDLTIRLVEEGSPIEGRIIDLEGRPLAGIRVEVVAFRFVREKNGRIGDSGDLSSWVSRIKEPNSSRTWEGLPGWSAGPSTIPPATSGPDGRFRLVGIGRERIAHLLIAGPSIESTFVFAMTRDEPEIRVVEKTFLGPKTVVFHSPRFDQPVASGKPIHGVARDKDTGKPIAGLKIQAAVYNPRSLVPDPGIEATTDQEGRYILTGLPKAPDYRVLVYAKLGLPYTNAIFKAAASDTPGMDPLAFDFVLKRGVVVRGRVTDKATGRPVHGHVNAFTFADSPLVGEYPGIAQSAPIFSYLDEDGQYEVVALPGRAIIACQSDIRRYRTAVGAGGIAGYDPKYDNFKTVPSFRGVANYHIMGEIQLDPKAKSATLDLQVDPGRTVELHVEDPKGRAIGGLKAEGTSESLLYHPITEESSTVEVRGLDPAHPRRVVVSHDGRKLVGSIWLKGDEAGPRTLRLQLWGVVTGRVLNDEDQPVRYRTITAGNNPPQTRIEEVGIFPGGTIGAGLSLDKDGRFRIEGLVPGLKYGASTGAAENGILSDLFKDVTVAPGEVKDLGDLKAQPLRRGEE